MITTQPGARTTATLEGAPAGRVITARLVDGDEILTTVVTVSPLLDSVGMALNAYTASFTAPPALPVVIEWLEGTAIVGSELVGLALTAASTAPPALRPTVAEVAILERSRTVTGGSGEEPTFTATTRPTATEVGQVIDQALEAILTQLPTTLGTEFYAQTRHMVALYAAILIEGSFFREQLDSGSVDLYRDLLRTGMLSLTEATTDTTEERRKDISSVVVRSPTTYDPALVPEVW